MERFSLDRVEDVRVSLPPDLCDFCSWLRDVCSEMSDDAFLADAAYCWLVALIAEYVDSVE